VFFEFGDFTGLMREVAAGENENSNSNYWWLSDDELENFSDKISEEMCQKVCVDDVDVNVNDEESNEDGDDLDLNSYSAEKIQNCKNNIKNLNENIYENNFLLKIPLKLEIIKFDIFGIVILLCVNLLSLLFGLMCLVVKWDEIDYVGLVMKLVGKGESLKVEGKKVQ